MLQHGVGVNTFVRYCTLQQSPPPEQIGLNINSCFFQISVLLLRLLLGTFPLALAVTLRVLIFTSNFLFLWINFAINIFRILVIIKVNTNCFFFNLDHTPFSYPYFLHVNFKWYFISYCCSKNKWKYKVQF